MEPLARAILAEHEARRPAQAAETIYLGGGTPTELPAELLAMLLGGLSGGRAAREVTVEANPESVDRERLDSLVAAGATRLSLGVQSTSDRVLRALGRRHDARAARSAFELAREAGVAAVSVDLMYGLPGQSEEDFRASLEEIVRWRPDHMSAYALELEPRVPMARRIASGRLRAPGEEQAARHYELACSILGGAGYEHYEISSFAAPGRRALHNQGYWLGRAYLGLGPGAHSFDGLRTRSWNLRRHREYVSRIEAGKCAAEGSEELSREALALEALMLGLRRAEGLSLEGPAWKPAQQYVAAWAARQDPARVRLEEDRLRLTEAGFWYSHGLTADLWAGLPESLWKESEEMPQENRSA